MSKATGYDQARDRLVHDCGVVYEDQYNQILASIFIYGDKGKPKIQLNRRKFEKGEWIYAKLGRVTYEEFAGIAKAVKAAFSAIAA